MIFEPVPKDFDPTIHKFDGSEHNLCSKCVRHPSHHFHTGVFGPECGCQDCVPLQMMETRKLNRPRAWFSRIINR
jgi:hypothetical protein